MENGSTLQPSGIKVQSVFLPLLQGVLVSSISELVALIDSAACHMDPQAFSLLCLYMVDNHCDLPA